MESKLKPVLTVTGAVLYVLLLIWPVYVILPMLVFTGWMKYTVILLVFAAEFALGTFFTIRQFKVQQATKKTGARVLFVLILISFLVYGVTALIYLVQVLLSVL